MAVANHHKSPAMEAQRNSLGQVECPGCGVRFKIYVFHQNGALVYQEILPESCGSILAVSFDDSGSEGLLIGGEQEVWQYTVEQR